MSTAGLEQANIETTNKIEYQPFEVDFSGSDFADGTLHGLQYLYRDQVLTDFTLKLAEEKTLKCHKSVLYLNSDFFSTLFTSEFRDSKSDEIDLAFLDADCVEAIIDFCYFGTLSIAWAKMELLIEAVGYFGIDQLWEACDEYISWKLTPENAKHWYSLALTRDLPYVKYTLSTDFFRSIADSEDFLTLPIENVKEIFENDFVFADEDEILQACAGWWLHGDNRSKDPDLSVFSNVRYNFCTKACMIEVGSRLIGEHISIDQVKMRLPLVKDSFVSPHLPVSTDQDPAKSQQTHTDGQIASEKEQNRYGCIVPQECNGPFENVGEVKSGGSENTDNTVSECRAPETPRKHSSVAQRLLLKKKEEIFGPNCKTQDHLWLRNTDGKWSKLTAIPDKMRYGSEVVTSKHACGILITGGDCRKEGEYSDDNSPISNKCMIYDSVRHQWYDGPNMIYGRCGHQCIEVNEKVYAIGGYKDVFYTDEDGNDKRMNYRKDIEVLCLDLYNMNWTEMAPMLGTISIWGTVTVQSCIFVIGSIDYTEWAFHKFETEKNVWMVLEAPTDECHYNSTTLYHKNGKIFKACERSETLYIHIYDIDTNTWLDYVNEIFVKRNHHDAVQCLHVLFDRLLFYRIIDVYEDEDDNYPEEKRKCSEFDTEQLKWVPFQFEVPNKEVFDYDEFYFNNFFTAPLADKDEDTDKLVENK